jgi:hypothetical protein
MKRDDLQNFQGRHPRVDIQQRNDAAKTQLQTPGQAPELAENGQSFMPGGKDMRAERFRLIGTVRYIEIIEID